MIDNSAVVEQIQRLRSYYHDVLSDHDLPSLAIRSDILRMFLYGYGFPLIYVLCGRLAWPILRLIPDLATEARDDIFSVGASLVFELLVTIAGLVIAGFSPALRIRLAMKVGRLVKPTPAARHAIDELLRDLPAYAMLNEPPQTLVAKRDPRVTPSVHLIRGQYCLVLPAGALILIRRDPESLKAMIAHELGHILQNDTILWEWSTIITSGLYYGLGVGVLAYILLSSIVHLGVPYTGVVLYFAIRIRMIRKKVLSARMRSEHFADTCAAAYGDPLALVRALTLYAQDAPQSTAKLHPTLAERIEWIRDFSPTAKSAGARP